MCAMFSENGRSSGEEFLCGFVTFFTVSHLVIVLACSAAGGFSEEDLFLFHTHTNARATVKTHIQNVIHIKLTVLSWIQFY